MFKMKLKIITKLLIALCFLIFSGCNSSKDPNASFPNSITNVKSGSFSYHDALISAIRNFPEQFDLKEYSISTQQIDPQFTMDADPVELKFYDDNWLIEFRKIKDTGVVGDSFVFIYVEKDSGEITKLFVR